MEKLIWVKTTEDEPLNEAGIIQAIKVGKEIRKLIHQILMKIAKFIVMNYRSKRKQIFETHCNSFEIVIK